jgi:hypothetical protein
MIVTQQALSGLAFPVARVRFAGPTDYHGARYYATLRRDSERTYRASVPYSYALSASENALRAARIVHEKALADTDGGAPADYVAIPGDLDASSYVFTFVPVYLLGEDAR